MFITLRITVGMCNVYLTEIYCNIEIGSIFRTVTSKSLIFVNMNFFLFRGSKTLFKTGPDPTF